MHCLVDMLDQVFYIGICTRCSILKYNLLFVKRSKKPTISTSEVSVSVTDLSKLGREVDDSLVYQRRLKGDLPHTPRPKVIDLFSGAGGLSSGFTHLFGHHFDLVWANDFNEYAAKTYNRNFGEHCVCGDVVDILQQNQKTIPKADVVIGGPPCQGFSLLNKFREEDPRKQLWRPFMDIVRVSGAQIFVMENVPQLIGSSEHEKIIDRAQELGFTLAWAKLCAADYGGSSA